MDEILGYQWYHLSVIEISIFVPQDITNSTIDIRSSGITILLLLVIHISWINGGIQFMVSKESQLTSVSGYSTMIHNIHKYSIMIVNHEQ